jgi:hypothetical protein
MNENDAESALTPEGGPGSAAEKVVAIFGGLDAIH